VFIKLREIVLNVGEFINSRRDAFRNFGLTSSMLFNPKNSFPIFWALTQKLFQREMQFCRKIFSCNERFILIHSKLETISFKHTFPEQSDINYSLHISSIKDERHRLNSQFVL
jgi:hypothetical protein